MEGERVGPQRSEPAEVQGAEDAREPGLRALLVAFVGGIALALLATGILGIFTDSLAAFFLVGELSFLAGVSLYVAARGWDLGKVLRLGAVPGAAYVSALKLGFALLIANFAATALLGPPVQDIEFVSAADDLVERVLLVLAVAAAAPVIEEAVFRGILQGVLERRFRPWIAIAATSLAFAILHGPRAALFFFFWSLPVGWVTWRGQSIRPAIVVHAVNNLVGLLGLLASSPVGSEPIELEMRGVVVALVLLAAAGGWAVRETRRLGGIVA